MAVKIFCSCCQRFIKDAKFNEISSLRGTEVCQDCEKRTLGLIDQLQKTADKAIKHITDIMHRTNTEMDEMKRMVIQGEKNGADS